MAFGSSDIDSYRIRGGSLASNYPPWFLHGFLCLCSRLAFRLLRGPLGFPKLYFLAFARLRAGCSLVAVGSMPAVEDTRS